MSDHGQQKKITHGVAVSSTDSGGIKRRVDVVQYDDGCYGVLLQTEYPDQQKPLETIFGLSAEAMSLLMAAQLEIFHNRDQWARTEAPAPQADQGGDGPGSA